MPPPRGRTLPRGPRRLISAFAHSLPPLRSTASGLTTTAATMAVSSPSNLQIGGTNGPERGPAGVLRDTPPESIASVRVRRRRPVAKHHQMDGDALAAWLLLDHRPRHIISAAGWSRTVTCRVGEIPSAATWPGSRYFAKHPRIVDRDQERAGRCGPFGDDCSLTNQSWHRTLALALPVGQLERMLLGDVRGWGCGRCSGRWW